MEHFPIVLALCRAAMAHPTPALRKQIERLRDVLVKEGEGRQAGCLSNLLATAGKATDMAPKGLARSKMQMPGDALTRNTPLPVDRETSAPLAQVLFPQDIRADAPVFNARVATAVQTFVDEWANVEALTEVGLEPAKTCLIFGDPGTGKTRLALWMARELDLPVSLVRLDGLVSSFLGTTARNIGNLFTFANRHRCILMLDEFDAIAKLRDDPQEVGEIKRVVNALLQNLDSRKGIGFTIGITNHPRLLDPAVWRRFEVQLEIPKPDFDVRVDIARQFMAPVSASETHLKLIAWFTEGGTGAEIEALVRTYKKAAAARVEGHTGLLETLRQFATLNSARVNAERRGQLFGDAGALFRAMRDDPELCFSLADIGEVAGKAKSTISRTLGRRGAQEAEEEGVSADG